MSQGQKNSSIRRIVVWGTCDLGKPRVRILLEGLRQNGIEVIECHHSLWGGIEDKSQVKGLMAWLRLALKLVLAYPALLLRYLRLPTHDWVLVGYPALLDVWAIRLFAWLRRKPVAMDWFLSAYDTIVLDRRMLGLNSVMAKFIYCVEWMSVRVADVVFMDTATHATRMQQLFQLPAQRCGRVWVGIEPQAFEIICNGTDEKLPPVKESVTVLFYGQFIPLHGLSTIVEAADLLRDENIDWLIIGMGQEAARIDALIEDLSLPKVRRVPWVNYQDLVGQILAADICLGIFGTSDKAASVIPNKVFQVLAAGRPIITRASPAIEELALDAYSDVALAPAGDAQALANAVRRWTKVAPKPDPARKSLVSQFLPAAIGQQCIDILNTRTHK